MTATPTPTTESIFRHACAFHVASDVLYQHITDGFFAAQDKGESFHTSVGTPWVVITAFATELYLKSLLMLESNSYPRIHALKQLYDRVSHAKQQRIKEFFDQFFYPALYEKIQQDKGQAVNRGDIGIEKRLNDAFEDWRYAFEDTDDETSYGDQALCGAVLNTILEIKPEWQEILNSQRTHTTSPAR